VAKTKDYHYFAPEQPDGRAAKHGACYGDGANQAVAPPPDEDWFVAPGPNSHLYDPVLSELAARMNESIRDVLPSRPHPRAEVGFLLMNGGMCAVWDVPATDAEWRDEFASGEGMEHMTGKSDNELRRIFDLPRSRWA
jgi:hypothetical protein